MSQKSPLSIVNETFGAKDKLVDKLMAMLDRDEEPKDELRKRLLASAKRSDTKRYGRFFHQMLDRGIYLPPAQLEAGFISLAHADRDIDTFITMSQEALAAVG